MGWCQGRVIRTLPSREITTVRLAEPRVKRELALASPTVSPTGEKVI